VTWKIAISGGNLSFSAAHFITLDGTYEPLHGHNYAVSAELLGDDLTTDSYVLDFGVVKDLLRRFIAEVNHRFLLPLHNPFMRVEHAGAEWEIHLSDGARYVLPEASVAALSFDNATAERLAEYFARRLCDALDARNARNITSVTVGIAETAMQTAFCTIPRHIE
jgi:6-pyruvoyl-tetrahydropterin synthase